MKEEANDQWLAMDFVIILRHPITRAYRGPSSSTSTNKSSEIKVKLK